MVLWIWKMKTQLIQFNKLNQLKEILCCIFKGRNIFSSVKINFLNLNIYVSIKRGTRVEISEGRQKSTSLCPLLSHLRRSSDDLALWVILALRIVYRVMSLHTGASAPLPSSFLSVSLGPISFHSSAFPPLFRLSFYTE